MKAVTRYCAFGTASVALIAVVAGCNAGTSVTPMQANDAAFGMRTMQTAAKAQGKARIVVEIPNAKGNARSIAPYYISPSTESLVAKIAGEAAQKFNLAAGSPGCVKKASELTCTETIASPAGTQDLTATLYDKKDGTGAALSTGSAKVKIVAGKITTADIAFDAIVATAKVLLDGKATATLSAGTKASVKVLVAAYDAAGDAITQPNLYSKAVDLTDSDPKLTSLSASSAAKADAPITLTYNGISVSGAMTATITPSVDGKAQRAGAATVSITPGQLATKPTSLTFSSATAQTINVVEPGYSGTFTASTSDATIATVSPSSASGPSAGITVTPTGGGSCTITIKDALGRKATVSVSVASGSIIVNSKHTTGGNR
jgi:hypothetical protein